MSVKSTTDHVVSPSEKSFSSPCFAPQRHNGMSNCSQENGHRRDNFISIPFLHNLFEICHRERDNASAVRASRAARESRNATGNSPHV